ncbi:ABC transporter permease [Nocardioides sp. LMS-CY]|uniref:ABC transporter permease n=1 Tax=Nocardioides sp. (strain LMS-CY) TaxID=2840457 RepID=UPI001C003614|nr:ABC transporter permease [Nocardioides sp. LMS-CY]QWF20996.1 ABC transporter permease [Nocardioides sp. LMS-CY]
MVYLARLVIGRLGSSLAVLLIAATATFFGTAFIDRRPESYLLGPTASPESVQLLHEKLGLDDPLLVQYLRWLAGAVQGDLGTSWASSQAVLDLVLSRLPATLSIVIGSMALAILVGVGFGVLAALHQSRATDRLISTGFTVGHSVPEFWLGILLVTAFALHWSLLPATGYVPFGESPTEWARSLVLPCVALALPVAATLGRHSRSAVVAQLGQDYVRWSVSTGLGRRTIMWGAVLKNALTTVVAIVALQMLAMLSLSIVVERVFAIQGMGGLVLSAALSQDIPVLMAGVIVYGAIVVVTNLVADVLQATLNPRLGAAS